MNIWAHHIDEFLALHDDVKFIISNLLASDLRKMMILKVQKYSSSYINCKIELIEDFPCNNEEELKNKKQ